MEKGTEHQSVRALKSTKVKTELLGATFICSKMISVSSNFINISLKVLPIKVFF